MMDAKLLEIQNFLSISDEEFDLKDVINETFQSQENKEYIVEKILAFIYNFAMFKDNRHFMKSVFKYLKKTLDIKLTSIADFEELLIKNSLMNFIQEYVEYANISQKEQVLNFLADSFERLGLQPLIINIGLLLKPMYTDQDYIDKLSKMEEVEVEYVLSDDIQMEIKKTIDDWLKTQELNLNKQEELKDKLKDEYDKLVEQHNLSKSSDSYKVLLTEVIEMLSMKLTMLSLMGDFGDFDDDLEPVPIN